MKQHATTGLRYTGYEHSDWPVQEIRNHLGERVAFYVAFLSHYTEWLFLVGTTQHGSYREGLHLHLTLCVSSAHGVHDGVLPPCAPAKLVYIHARAVDPWVPGSYVLGAPHVSVLATAFRYAAPHVGTRPCPHQLSPQPESQVRGCEWRS